MGEIIREYAGGILALISAVAIILIIGMIIESGSVGMWILECIDRFL